MDPYEGLFIIDPDLGQDASKAVLQAIVEAITRNGGAVTETQEWGRKKLAYLINKKREGVYVFLHFTLKTDALSKLVATLRLNEQVMKQLITRKEVPPRVRTRVRSRPDDHRAQEANAIHQ